MKDLNEFMIMWLNYPDPSEVLDLVFSEENSPKTSKATRNWVFATVKNSCCIRLSHALNSTVEHKIPKRSGVEAITGAKGKYIFRVTDMSTYLNNRYGKADYLWHYKYKKKRNDFRQEITDKKGIIVYHSPGGGINGHVDLWENGVVKTYDLFDSSYKIEFWEAS